MHTGRRGRAQRGREEMGETDRKRERDERKRKGINKRGVREKKGVTGVISKDRDGRCGTIKKGGAWERDKDRASKRGKEAASLLTTIISDGSKVMHSQPRLPPSCLPKLWREHTRKQMLKQTQTKARLFSHSDRGNRCSQSLSPTLR